MNLEMCNTWYIWYFYQIRQTRVYLHMPLKYGRILKEYKATNVDLSS